MKISIPYFRLPAVLLCALVFFISAAQAQSTAFTYQGQLNDGATAANGTYNMQFSLYDAASGGNQAGTTISNTAVTVLNGVFTVQLDFSTGTPFAAGAGRFLQIAVKKPADAAYTTLTPRQTITSSPYSVRTINAGTSDALSAACAGCVADAQIAAVSGSKVTGTVANATTAVSATTAANAANVTGTVSLTNGGTGATSAAAARTNLGLGTLAAITPTGTASSTTFLRGDNTWQTVSAGGSAPVFSTRTSSVTITSSTLVNVISIQLEANKTYYIESSIYGQRSPSATVNGTANQRVTYTGSGTTELGVEVNGFLVMGTTFNATSFDLEAAGATGSFATSVNRRFGTLGYIKTTTAGTLSIQVGRTAANTTVDLVVREGSFLRATPLN